MTTGAGRPTATCFAGTVSDSRTWALTGETSRKSSANTSGAGVANRIHSRSSFQAIVQTTAAAPSRTPPTSTAAGPSRSDRPSTSTAEQDPERPGQHVVHHHARRAVDRHDEGLQGPQDERRDEHHDSGEEHDPGPVDVPEDERLAGPAEDVEDGLGHGEPGQHEEVDQPAQRAGPRPAEQRRSPAPSRRPGGSGSGAALTLSPCRGGRPSSRAPARCRVMPSTSRSRPASRSPRCRTSPGRTAPAASRRTARRSSGRPARRPRRTPAMSPRAASKSASSGSRFGTSPSRTSSRMSLATIAVGTGVAW